MRLREDEAQRPTQQIEQAEQKQARRQAIVTAPGNV